MENTETNNVQVRLERRKGITFNLELHKSSYGYPIFLRIYLFFFAQVLAKTTATTASMATQDRWIVAAKSAFFIK